MEPFRGVTRFHMTAAKPEPSELPLLPPVPLPPETTPLEPATPLLPLEPLPLETRLLEPIPTSSSSSSSLPQQLSSVNLGLDYRVPPEPATLEPPLLATLPESRLEPPTLLPSATPQPQTPTLESPVLSLPLEQTTPPLEPPTPLQLTTLRHSTASKPTPLEPATIPTLLPRTTLEPVTIRTPLEPVTIPTLLPRTPLEPVTIPTLLPRTTLEPVTIPTPLEPVTIRTLLSQPPLNTRSTPPQTKIPTSPTPLSQHTISKHHSNHYHHYNNNNNNYYEKQHHRYQHHHRHHRTKYSRTTTTTTTSPPLQDTGWTRNMLLWLALFLVSPLSLIQHTLAEVIYQDYVAWTPPMGLRGYRLFADAQLLEFTVPEASTQSIWKFQSFSDDASCETKQVYIYLQYGSFPIVNLTNLTFPDTFYLKRTFSERFIIRSDDRTTVINMDAPRHGPWFAAAFLPNENEKIQQKGLLHKCLYSVRGMLVTQTRKGYGQAVANTLLTTTLKEGFNNKMKYYKIVLPPLSYLYHFSVVNCTVDSQDTGGCPIYVSVGNGNMPPFVVDQFLINCTNSTEKCRLRVESPNTLGYNFVAFYLRDINCSAPVTVTWRITSEECELQGSTIAVENSTEEEVEDTSSSSLATTTITTTQPPTSDVNSSSLAGHQPPRPKCVVLPGLGQFSSAMENFNSIYVFPNQFLMPKRNNTLTVPDTHPIITSFNVQFLTNSGGTIAITLHFDNSAKSWKNQSSVIKMCVVKDGYPAAASVDNCTKGVLLTVSSSDTTVQDSKVHIPYPEFGDYYVALISRCYNSNTEMLEACHTLPVAQFSITHNRCLDHSCGRYGQCSEYISGLYVFSACRCFAGWKGYACTDGSEANPDSLELLAVMLLTLSNGFFLPAIVLAFYRHYYLEGIVYMFTMFFSAMYHACDASNLYKYCLLKYDVLSFSDFLGSYLAVWVTLMVMARLPDALRTILDLTGALFVALAVTYDKHSLFLNVFPLSLGIVVVLITWGCQCRQRHHCYPTLRRYIFCLVPGSLMALVGVLLFSLFETESNYMYVHSMWHILIATSIVFLLPTRRQLSDGSSSKETLEYPSLENFDSLEEMLR